MPSRDLLSEADVEQALTRLSPGWAGDTSRLTRSIEFADFRTAVEFVDTLAPRATHWPRRTASWRRGRRSGSSC